MDNIVEYVMGVAAKSNVEKRRVGCVLVHDGVIIAEGYNHKSEHAEEAAVKNLKEGTDLPLVGTLTAYVTHPPCPACAKALADVGVTVVEVVDPFMKFDGDKLRFDLVDGDFGLWCVQNTYGLAFGGRLSSVDLKERLYSVNANHKNALRNAVLCVLSGYKSYLDAEKHLVAVLTFGARKYKPNNWRNCTDSGRFLAAAHRHANAIAAEELVDPESNLPHIAHVLTNLMFLYVLDAPTLA